MTGPPQFEIDDVTVRFGDSRAIEHLNLRVAAGEKVVIRGKSGSGKSTMLRLLLGFTRAADGRVRIGGEAMRPDLAWKLRKEIAYVNQNLDFEAGTVEDTLTTIRPADRQQLLAAIRQFDLPESILTQEIADVSGGERQRIALAAAILLGRSIFLLDEPTAALDSAMKRRVADFFLSHDGWTVIAVSHDDAWLQPESPTIVDLDDRRP